MGLVAAKCPNCGANVEIDPNTEMGVCTHCGSTFLTQKAIINYNNTIINHNNISAQSINIISGDFNNLMQNAIESWDSKDYSTAYNQFLRALEINPNYPQALLYKSLCLGILKDNLSAPVKTFNEIINKEENLIPLEEQSRFLHFLDNIGKREYNQIFSEFTTEFDGKDYILAAWRKLENLLILQKTLINCQTTVYGKKSSDENKKALIAFLKDIICIYDALCQKWQRLMPFDYRYHVSDTHPNKDKFLQEKSKFTEKIRELDPEYNPPDTTGGCYVATCVYGSYDCPQVWTLRRYRDYKLAKTWYGKTFIHIYYTFSPTIVKLFGKTKWFKKLWKGKLDKMVNDLNKKGFKNTPYKDKQW